MFKNEKLNELARKVADGMLLNNMSTEEAVQHLQKHVSKALAMDIAGCADKYNNDRIINWLKEKAWNGKCRLLNQ